MQASPRPDLEVLVSVLLRAALPALVSVKVGLRIDFKVQQQVQRSAASLAVFCQWQVLLVVMCYAAPQTGLEWVASSALQR